jgi:hypothetical protein
VSSSKRSTSALPDGRSSSRVERGQSTTPGVWAERLNKVSDTYRIRWTGVVGINGQGGSTSKATNPRTGETSSLSEKKFRGNSPAAVRARAQACEWVLATLENRRTLRSEGETIASRTLDSLIRLIDDPSAIGVDPHVVARVLRYAVDLAMVDKTGIIGESLVPLLTLCTRHAWTPTIRALANSGDDLPALIAQLEEQPKGLRCTISLERIAHHIVVLRRFAQWSYSSAVWRDEYNQRHVGRLISPRYLDETVLQDFASSLKVGTRTATSTRATDLTILRGWLYRLEARERPRLSDLRIKDALKPPKEPNGRNVVSTRRDGGSPVMYLPDQLQSIINAGLRLDALREAPCFDGNAKIVLGPAVSLTLLFWSVFGSRACETIDTDVEDGAVSITGSLVTLVTAKTGKLRHLSPEYAPLTFQAIEAQSQFNAALIEHGFQPNKRGFIFAPTEYPLGASGEGVAHTKNTARLIALGAPRDGRWRFRAKSLRSTVGSYLAVANNISGTSEKTSTHFASTVLGNTPTTLARSYLAEHIRPVLKQAGVDFNAPDIETMMQIDRLAQQVRDRILRRIDRIPEVIAAVDVRARKFYVAQPKGRRKAFKNSVGNRLSKCIPRSSVRDVARQAGEERNREES